MVSAKSSTVLPSCRGPRFGIQQQAEFSAPQTQQFIDRGRSCLLAVESGPTRPRHSRTPRAQHRITLFTFTVESCDLRASILRTHLFPSEFGFHLSLRISRLCGVLLADPAVGVALTCRNTAERERRERTSVRCATRPRRVPRPAFNTHTKPSPLGKMISPCPSPSPVRHRRPASRSRRSAAAPIAARIAARQTLPMRNSPFPSPSMSAEISAGVSRPISCRSPPLALPLWK